MHLLVSCNYASCLSAWRDTLDFIVNLKHLLLTCCIRLICYETCWFTYLDCTSIINDAITNMLCIYIYNASVMRKRLIKKIVRMLSFCVNHKINSFLNSYEQKTKRNFFFKENGKELFENLLTQCWIPIKYATYMPHKITWYPQPKT